MDIKSVLIILIVLMELLLFSSTNAVDESTVNDTVILNLSSEGWTVSQMADDIRNESYFEGYDEDVLEWLESLDGYVFSSPQGYVVVSSDDAGKIPMEFATDVDIRNFIECRIVENRSLGENLSDIIVVQDVEFKNQETRYYDV